jgi:hypothetical protein
MGFGIGHFRDALAVAEAEEAAKVALTSFLDHPFLLKDVFSYLLLGLTFLSGIFAVLDGYHYTDTYPGYAAEELRFNKAQEKWSAFFEDLTQDLNALKDKYIAELHASVGRAQNALKALKTLKLDKEAMLSKYQNAHKNAHAAVKSIVGKYRSENTLARTTPAPAYFRSYENFNFQNIPNIVAGAEWEEQRTALIKVEDGEIRELSERLRSLENDQEMMEKTIIKAYQDQTGALEAQRQAVFTSNPKFDKNGQDDISSNLFVPTPSL